MTDLARAVTRSRWLLPLLSLSLGVLFFVAFWLGDQRGSAWFSLALMGGVGALILVGGRFDMVRGLRGDGRDEYWSRIDLLATALAGSVLIGRRHRDVPLGVGARSRRLALRPTRRARRRELRRGARAAQVAFLSESFGQACRRPSACRPASPQASSDATESAARTAGRSSCHVHLDAFLSSRNRMSLVPWRNRFDCTLS